MLVVHRLLLTTDDSPDSIFHDEATGILFASFKYVGYNWEGDMEKMRENPKVREWWRMTDGYQESMVPGAVSSEAGEPSWWKGLEEVFYYDGAAQ
jgi:L-rhamnose mutarotase